MATVLTPPHRTRKTRAVSNGAEIRTLADLLHDLGDIPAERVWLTPTPGTATEADVIAIEAKYNRLCELVDGTLVEKAMGQREAREALVLGSILDQFMDEHDLGIIYGADATLRIMPNLVRIPDVSYVSWSRLPGGELPSEPIPDLVPDLAIEVLSASNTLQELKRKLGEYFDAGVRQVWFVDGVAKTFEVFTSPRKSQVFSGEQVVSGGKLLPGFKLSVEAFFRRVYRKKK
jgi:Uma2 family endonuclease